MSARAGWVFCVLASTIWRPALPRSASREHWCGPICVPAEDQFFPYGNSGYIRIPDRPWEALRYHLVAVLGVAEGQWALPRSRQPAWRRLAEVWDSLALEWPLSVFHTITWGEAMECPIGRFVLRVTSAASASAKGNLWEGGMTPEAEEVLDAMSELLQAPWMLDQAFCSGWPLFHVVASLTELFGTPRHGPSPASSGHGPGPSDLVLGPDRLAKVAPHAFLASNGDEEHSALDMGASAAPSHLLAPALLNCSGEASMGVCILSAAELLDQLQSLQAEAFFGLGICPAGSLAAWVDMRVGTSTLPSFPMCVRSARNHVDHEIRLKGTWSECAKLWAINQQFGGDERCTILDVGANIGACTLLLAHLRLRVVAFEPLPRNADLLEASLALNDIVPAPLFVDGGKDKGARNGGVTVLRVALGDKTDRGGITERVGNAGDSRVSPAGSPLACDNKTVVCHYEAVRMVRLDDVINTFDWPICLVKIDVQGSELQVLQGAHALLRARLVGVLFFEWRPDAAISRGEDPTEPLLYLHQMGYRLLAPMHWFQFDPIGAQWALFSPKEFPVVVEQKGNILATAESRDFGGLTTFVRRISERLANESDEEQQLVLKVAVMAAVALLGTNDDKSSGAGMAPG